MTNDTYNTEKVFHLDCEHIYHFSVNAISNIGKKKKRKISIPSFILSGVLYINTEEKARLKYSNTVT